APKKPTAPQKAPSLFSPEDGARVTGPPVLRWPAVSSAAYYNVQIYRAGVKVLSTWPQKNRLQIHPTWTYKARQFSLKPGTYVWLVWPGFGPLAAAKYGKQVVRAVFVVRAP